eukprot:COSAG01_NODE_39_length_33243_cov_28.298558_28_plen_63_part_00
MCGLCATLSDRPTCIRAIRAKNTVPDVRTCSYGFLLERLIALATRSSRFYSYRLYSYMLQRR